MILVVTVADGLVEWITNRSGSDISGATAGAFDLVVVSRISDKAREVDFNSSRK